MTPPAWAFQTEHFEPPPDDELICSVCRGVFCEPVQCPCHHVFCRACITKWLQTNRNCPVCRKRATNYCIEEVVPLIRNMIMKLTLHCRNSEHGCREKFALEGCENHMKECIYEMVRCKNKPCRHECFRKDIADHELNGCLHRYVRCETCCMKISSVSPNSHDCIRDLKLLLK
ncbi:RING finger protein 151-like, partial [Stegodyphus dumicola]|uniref:RING finger protein 151-like n=1 Tax=Stegodyphus dumicola TaxID=202533 RepID=UPI0015AB74A3